MKKILMVIIPLVIGIGFKSLSQKKYGYAILYFRCGDDEPQKNRIYYSPVIELNTLNFPEYTDGVDPAIAQYSVRYYNYAISKWFELYLRDKYKVLINEPEKYERRSGTVIYNEKNKISCNAAKTNSDCFFMSKDELTIIRKNDISESRSVKMSDSVCEVVDLK